jgi:hypothetical protein
MTTNIDLLKIPLQEFRPIEVRHMSLNPSHSYCAVVLANKTFQILEAKRLSLLKTSVLPDSLEPIGVFWAHKQLLGVISAEGFVFLFAPNNLNKPIQKLFISSAGLLGFHFSSPTNPTGPREAEYLGVCGADGSVHVFENPLSSSDIFNESDLFRLKSVIHRSEGACLSCRTDPLGRWVLAGYSDGNLRKIGLEKANSLQWSVSVGKEASVLCLEVFADRLVVVGTVHGKVHVHDLKLGVSVQILKDFSVSHVTCLAIDQTNEVVYWSGFDSRVFAAKFDSSSTSFQVIGQNRGQSHEVNALLVSHGSLISAGKTSDFCFFQIGPSGFLERENQSKLHIQQSLGRLDFHCRDGRVGYVYQGAVNLVGFSPGQSPSDAPRLDFQLLRDESPTAVSFLVRNHTIAVASRSSSKICFYDTQTGSLKAESEYLCAKSFASKSYFWFSGDWTRGICRGDAQGKLKTFRTVPPLPRHVLEDPDTFETSENEESLLIGNSLSRDLWVVDLKNSAAQDVSFLAKQGTSVYFCFFGRTQKVIYLRDRQLCLYHPIKKTSFVLFDKVPVEPAGRAFKGLTFTTPSKKVVLLWSDYHIVFLDTTSGRKSVTKLAAPALMVDNPLDDIVLRIHVDWQKAAATLESPVFTKKFSVAQKG